MKPRMNDLNITSESALARLGMDLGDAQFGSARFTAFGRATSR